ncbi:nucleotidyltransferase [Promethearchaeum syntrophicum]|uniref:Nucleotidyltransferase n=1 Tax=Promethearchaeum syntrophicum TaxID=2594042 RepID=A0A5B9D814_9ARCH|nr:nucleotidyltransferase [Candidatus Prometheoarchaeum syntrophicum]QEE15274.1 hypothetical protein DSAG12_01099 [Candidatus Prometheoarchaeum syntrophicum]
MAKTVSAAFEEFKTLIEPSPEERKKIITRHEYIRNNISEFITLDKNNSSFLSGSYIRSTQITPVNDVDIVLVLDKDTYYDKYKTEIVKLLEHIKRMLKKLGNYQTTEMRKQTHSIGMLLRHGAKVDIVPAFLKNSEENIYEILDKDKNCYIETAPQNHKELISNYNKEINNFIPVVKMLKNWKNTINNQLINDKFKIKSFHLELLAINAINNSFSGYRDGIIQFFQNAEQLTLKKLEDPLGISGDISSYLSSEQKKTLNEKIEAINEKINKLRDYESKGEHQKAISGWRQILGHPFPDKEKSTSQNNQTQEKRETKHPKHGKNYIFGK